MENFKENYRVCMEFLNLKSEDAKKLLTEILKERNKKPTS